MKELTARQRVSYLLREIIAHVLFYTGLLYLRQRIILRRKAVVLMYHRVLTPQQRRETASQPGIIVENATFARQIAFLKRQFRVLTLEEFEERLAGRRPFENSCCLITFDDGWIDNYFNALPVLREEGVPAVIFLPVNFIGSRRLFTREALTHLLWRVVTTGREDPARQSSLRAVLAPLGLDTVLDVRSEPLLAAIIATVERHKYANGPAFEALVQTLTREFANGAAEVAPQDTFIDWPQVESMARSGVVFGGHGAEHRVLTEIPSDAVDDEVATSKQVLDHKLTSPVRAFAYPGGGCNPNVAEAVRRAGYQLAFTIEPGYIGAGANPFGLHRVNIHEGMTRSTPMFLARLTGLF